VDQILHLQRYALRKETRNEFLVSNQILSKKGLNIQNLNVSEYKLILLQMEKVSNYSFDPKHAHFQTVVVFFAVTVTFSRSSFDLLKLGSDSSRFFVQQLNEFFMLIDVFNSAGVNISTPWVMLILTFKSACVSRI